MIVRFSTDAARHELTPVDNRFILEYLPHATGLAVQVYLYGLMQCFHSSTSETSVADAMGLSDNAVLDAYAYWQTQGLVLIRCEKPLTVEYLGFEAAASAEQPSPAKYAKLVSALNSLTAPRMLDLRELKHVYDWIEVFQLDEDAVLELVSHCMSIKGRRVSINYISAVAQSWAESGIHTRADALQNVENYDLRKHGASTILREWNKRRKPTKAEMALYDKWIGEWGFTDEAIQSVLPRLSVSGTPNFIYLDEQLEQLHRTNQTAASDIATGDIKDAEERAFARLVFERAGKLEPATKTQRAQIAMYAKDFSMPRELLLFGAEQCRGANEPFGLMKKIWNDWHEAGIDTIEKATAALRTRSPAALPQAAKARTVGYTQHELTDEQLDALLVDLDKEL
ncbi:MAG: DnaD domain protein [Clostridia bacterium]